MAYQVTLGTIMTRVRQRANVQNVTQAIGDDELTDMINQSLAEWYDKVRLSTFGGQYYRSTYSFQTVGAQASYALPADFCNMISVDVFLSPNTTTNSSLVRSAKAFQEEQRNMFKFWPVGGWLLTTPIFYMLQGPNITFIPTPQSQFAIALNYVPVAPRLVATTDQFDSINGWDEWIVIDVAIKCLQKGNKTERINQLTPHLLRQEQRILAAAPQRDMYGTERVHDVTDEFELFDF